jgi:hypothetical protein
MKYQNIVLAAACSFSSMMAHSEPLSWTYIRADYNIETVELDGVTDDLEGDSISFEGSISPVEHFAIIAGYATGSADVSGNGNTVEFDLDAYYLGGLFYTSVSESTDFFAGARFLDYSSDVSLNGTSAGTVDADGNGIFLGVRGKVSPKVELSGVIERTDIEDETDTDIGFEAGYYITPDFSVNVGYNFDNDATALSFGAVKYF